MNSEEHSNFILLLVLVLLDFLLALTLILLSHPLKLFLSAGYQEKFYFNPGDTGFKVRNTED